MLVNREVILAKLESTYNADPTPAAGSDAVLVESPSWTNEGARMIERANVKATLGKDQSIFAGSLKAVSFEMEIKGSGSAGTPPEMGPLLRGCGLGETIVASTSVTYAPVSTAQESITIYYYADGMLHKLTGCRGNVSFSMEAGGAGKASFSFTGHNAGVTDAAMVTPSYDSTVPAPVINVPFTIGGYASVINSLSVDLSNGLATPSDMSSSDGFGEVIITARDVNGSFDPEAVLKATKDYINEWEAGTTMALSCGVIGSSAGNRYKVDMPAVYYREVGQGDRDGLRTFDISYGATESTGDDEISLAFT
jgi:hypothetical protein